MPTPNPENLSHYKRTGIYYRRSITLHIHYWLAPEVAGKLFGCCHSFAGIHASFHSNCDENQYFDHIDHVTQAVQPRL